MTRRPLGFLPIMAGTVAALSVAATLSMAFRYKSAPRLMSPSQAAQTTTQTNDVKPDGTARPTAQSWTGSPLEFEYANRDQTLRIQKVMDLLKIKRGSRVADVGAGGGWLSVRLARRVQSTGVVYAQEILPKYTDFIAQRARREGLGNIRTILGTTSDPKLPADTLDAVVILNAYHEFDKPLAMLRKIRASMKPGARLGFIERDEPALRREARDAYAATGKIKRRLGERSDNNPATDDHRLAREIVQREATSAGFKLVQTMDLEAPFYVVVVQR